MRFSLHDLFLVTVIVALALGWWVDRNRQAARLNKELEWRSSLIDMEGPLDVFYQGKRQHVHGNIWVELLPNAQTPAPNPPKQ